MSNIFRHIANFIVKPVKPVSHPFVKKEVELSDDRTEETAPQSDTVAMWWGDKTTLVKVDKWKDQGTAASWEILTDDKYKLPPGALDEFDRAVINKYKVIADNYKQVKPYILAKYEYAVIAEMVEQSVSWVQKLGPRVKEAAVMRKKASPPVEKVA